MNECNSSSYTVSPLLFVCSSLLYFHLTSFHLSHVCPCSSCQFLALQGLKARNFIHSKIEENIKKKVQESDKEFKHRDALQQLIDSSKKNGEPFSMQVLT